MFAVDYTSRIDPAALQNAGVSDVFRYLCYLPNPKVIRDREYAELQNAGIRVTLNWEFDSRDWNNGQSVGVTHGTLAGEQAHQLGYPEGATIFGSADYDMPWADWAARARHYAAGFATGVQAYGYRPGVYGPWDVLKWVQADGIMDRFWQAGMSTAWSHGDNRQAWPGAHVRQRRHVTIGGVDTDYNDILIPSWGQAWKGTVMDRAAEQNANADRYLYLMAEEIDPITEILSNGKEVEVPNLPLRRLKRIEDQVGQILAALPRLALVAEDRERLDNLARALDTATGGGLSAEDKEAITELRTVLSGIAAHLK